MYLFFFSRVAMVSVLVWLEFQFHRFPLFIPLTEGETDHLRLAENALNRLWSHIENKDKQQKQG